jgi:hypothetical protein
MGTPWWPDGAPYPRRPFAEYATFELAALTAFAAELTGPRGVQLHGELIAERDGRREMEREQLERLTAGAAW